MYTKIKTRVNTTITQISIQDEDKNILCIYQFEIVNGKRVIIYHYKKLNFLSYDSWIKRRGSDVCMEINGWIFAENKSNFRIRGELRRTLKNIYNLESRKRKGDESIVNNQEG